MKLYLWIVGAVIALPGLLGSMAAIAVDSYRGDGRVMGWIALGLFAASWAWGRFIDKPKLAKAPRKFSVERHETDEHGVTFYGRFEDGQPHSFRIDHGTTGSLS